MRAAGPRRQDAAQLRNALRRGARTTGMTIRTARIDDAVVVARTDAALWKERGDDAGETDAPLGRRAHRHLAPNRPGWSECGGADSGTRRAPRSGHPTKSDELTASLGETQRCSQAGSGQIGGEEQ